MVLADLTVGASVRLCRNAHLRREDDGAVAVEIPLAVDTAGTAVVPEEPQAVIARARATAAGINRLFLMSPALVSLGKLTLLRVAQQLACKDRTDRIEREGSAT